MVRSIGKVPAAALIAVVALSGCTRKKDGNKGGATPAPTTSSSLSPGATAPPLALSATAIADKLGCTDRKPGVKAASDPVDPVEAIDCTVAEDTYKIRTYRTNTDRDAVLKATPDGTGYRNVGERSLVATDKEQAATFVQQQTGATIVDLRYTTPGS